MRKLVLLMCFSVLTMYTFNISLFAEDSTASREQPVVSESGDKNPVVDTSDIDEDVEYVDDENVDYVDISMDATFVKDSFPSYNRAVFAFNDKLYYYFFRPLSKGYKAVLPEVARLGVRNFFVNVRTPGRFFNCLFQGKFRGAGTELSRLIINSTIGGAGFSDPAKKYFHLDLQDEDFGQTLGSYNTGAGSHLELPFFGPSNVRDAFGLIIDTALDPVTLLMFVSPYAPTGAKAYIAINDISIDKGDTYEGLVEQAIDPYIAVQDAYAQNRAKKIKE
ncbi:MAG: VacJ family lipoprotein [Candidatus Scalindua rubra]|uniref:Lipoprotein n=1 Tax=Candidatus Scalindua brodae TaxID=237368 RepID=A0A0B0EIF3_9BACT|nr:MAG: lipoprotein [Candidatus Scalindua brodae]MBZ0107411.1 VacJ family lipoprotein [Candidatus Scalindua rubra]TWU32736.1 putative phospholipid-binding lipoprotein MlaA precursor [Candidatus Brocadiaceae bacterium S225]